MIRAARRLLSIASRRWLTLTTAGLLAGCAQQEVTIADTFPPAAAARPWSLSQAPWSGAFEQAAAALGDDAQRWRTWQPQRVWLAVYVDPARPDARLTVRVFSFADAQTAGLAWAALRPAGCEPFRAGDAGCWTDDGVIFRWGRLVYEVFVASATERLAPEQTATVVGWIEKRTPADLPGEPR